RVGAAHRSLPWAVGTPRSERSTGVDISNRLGICQPGIEVHGKIGTDGRHLQTFDIEFEREFSRLESIDDQDSSVADEAIDSDFYFSPMHRSTLFLRRQV